MSPDPLYGFVFLGLASPGPNVVLLTASGAQFGFHRTLPHILGVALGVGVTSGLTGLGVTALLFSVPGLELALRLGAFGWILYMAWQLAHRAPPGAAGSTGRPFTFIEAVLFQWVNPKVWIVALTAAAGYPSGAGPVAEGIRLGTAFSGLNLLVCIFWTAAGGALALLMNTPAAWRGLNIVMAVFLAATGLMVFL